MRGHIVYTHTRQDNGKVFYVGYGYDRGRAYDEKSRSKAWKNVLSETYFDVDILATGLSKKSAENLEIEMIDFYGIDNLVNKTKGGSGISGYNHTNETKERISKAALGRKFSEESVIKAVETKRSLYSAKYINIKTKELIIGLKWACEKYNVNYQAESQRIRRNSKNRIFNKVL